MGSKQQLKNIIDNSNLSTEDKKIWDNFLQVATEIQIGMVYDFLKDSPEELEFMTNNLKEKIEAAFQKDQAKMDEILEREKEHLKNLE